MKKRSIAILISVVTILTLILSSCIVEVKVTDTVYGQGFVANIDCISPAGSPHRVRIKNSSGENLTVKYQITETNDAAYDLQPEPIWSSVTNNITIASGEVQNIQTNLGSSSSNYACVWMRAQDPTNNKYIIFSVFLSKADNMEYDVTIKKGK